MNNLQKSYILTQKGRKKLLIALLIGCFMATLMNLCVGSTQLSLMEILDVIILGKQQVAAETILLLVRLPRVCACLLAGMALAVSGTIIQGVLSNPLAAPNIIGVNAGAGLAIAVCCTFFPTETKVFPFAAFLGATLSTLLVLEIAERTVAAKMTLVLAGISVSSIFNAIIDGIITVFPDALSGYSDFRIGGFFNVSFDQIKPSVGVIVIGVIIAFSLHNELDVMMLGSETARSLGLSTKKVRIVLLSIAAALAGAAVSFSGLLGFVGLVVPNIMRRFVGDESKCLLLASALGGAVLLATCDLVARVAFAPYEIPVGIVMSLVGGPFFISILLSQRKRRTHD